VHGRPVGVIAHSNSLGTRYIESHPDIPAVTIGACPGRPDVPWVAPDYTGRGVLAAEHFHERLLKHVGFAGTAGSPLNDEMLDGLRRRAGELGIEIHEFAHSIHSATVLEAPEHPIFLQWLRDLPKPAGLLLAFGDVTQGLAVLCAGIGISIPGELAVLSGCHSHGNCEMCTPEMSFVEDNVWQIGYESARLLERVLRGRSVPSGGVRVPPVRVHAAASTDILVAGDDRLGRALRYVRENAFEKVTVEDVAGHARLSRRRLEQMFHAMLGVSVHEEISRVRIARAKALLGSSNLPLADVAVRCGLEWSTSLGKLFRKHVGVTPGEYRKRLRRRIRGQEA
jgi:LacI family transcriptional regulator